MARLLGIIMNPETQSLLTFNTETGEWNKDESLSWLSIESHIGERNMEGSSAPCFTRVAFSEKESFAFLDFELPSIRALHQALRNELGLLKYEDLLELYKENMAAVAEYSMWKRNLQSRFKENPIWELVVAIKPRSKLNPGHALPEIFERDEEGHILVDCALYVSVKDVATKLMKVDMSYPAAGDAPLAGSGNDDGHRKAGYFAMEITSRRKSTSAPLGLVKLKAGILALEQNPVLCTIDLHALGVRLTVEQWLHWVRDAGLLFYRRGRGTDGSHWLSMLLYRLLGQTGLDIVNRELVERNLEIAASSAASDWYRRNYGGHNYKLRYLGFGNDASNFVDMGVFEFV